MDPSQAPGCSSTTLAIRGIGYSRVCGKIIAFQYASPNSFKDHPRSGSTINDNYVDGISLTSLPEMAYRPIAADVISRHQVM